MTHFGRGFSNLQELGDTDWGGFFIEIARVRPGKFCGKRFLHILLLGLLVVTVNEKNPIRVDSFEIVLMD